MNTTIPCGQSVTSLMKRALASSLLLGPILGGCSGHTAPPHCTGNVVDTDNITLTDKATGNRVCDATVFTADGRFQLGLFGSPEYCFYSFPFDTDGGIYRQNESFDANVVAPGYAPVVVHDVRVFVWPCNGPRPPESLQQCLQCVVQLTPIVGGTDAGDMAEAGADDAAPE